MGPEELLKAACELSYIVAREGAESQPTLDPPSAMKSFLFVAQLPGRALTVAQQAIEDDPSFRRRVAERATEGDVGRAGFLWLHRPIGWAAEFEELSLNQARPGPVVLTDDEPELSGSLLSEAVISGSVLSEAVLSEAVDVVQSGDEPDESHFGVSDDADPAWANFGLAPVDLESGVADVHLPELDDRGHDLVDPDLADPDLADEDLSDEDLSDEDLDDQDLDDGRELSEPAQTVEVMAVDGPAYADDRYRFDTDDEIVQEPSVAYVGSELAESVGAADPVGAVAGSFGSIDVFGNGSRGLELPPPLASRGRSEANAIESELLSLRGLVDRLSNERKAVSSSVRQAEQDLAKSRYQPSMFDSDVYTLQSELEAARAELDGARRERDTAVRQHSDSLTRQLELEKELERSREMRAEIEREHAEADASMVDVRESLARAEAALTGVQDDREELAQNLAATRTENEDLKLQVSRLTDLNANQTKALEAQHKALQSEAETLRTDKDGLAARLSGVETELNNAKVQLSQTGNQASEAKSLVDALTEEKIDLASRLADTEAMLETTRAQLGAVKSDSEAIAADLSNIRAHRDGLSTQVEELHGSLTEALTDLAKVRATSDADRAGLKEVRSERDLLRVRVGSLEQIEKGLEAKLANLASERDAFALRSDQAKAELADRERQALTTEAEKDRVSEELITSEEATAALSAERDELRADIEGSKARATELELARDGLAVQVEQLTDENSAIQAQMMENDRQQKESSDNQGRALSELAHRLAMADNDRNRLDGELQDTEERLAEALNAVEKAMETAEKARQEAARMAASMEASVAPMASMASAPAVSLGLDPTTADPVPAPPAAHQAHAEPEIEPATAIVSHVEDAMPASPADESWPPPPGPDAVAVAPALDPPIGVPGEGLAISAETPVAANESDESRRNTEGRPARRHLWNLGPRSRTESGVEPEPTEQGYEIESPEEAGPADPVPAEEGLLFGLGDAVPPPPAPSTEPAALAETEADVDLDSISSELSQAVEEVGLIPASDDEDLDEISKLIKQTVTEFDPSSLQPPTVAVGPAPQAGDPAGEPRRRGRGRRLFATRNGEDWKQQDGGDDDVTGPSALSGLGPAANPSGMPPSVFGDNARFSTPGADPDQTLVVKGGPTEGPKLAFDVPTSGPRDQSASEHPSGSSTKPGRRQIEIPSDVADDVEMARRVVSSPDVVLLVDGDSVAKMGWPSLPVAQQRDALVSYLADLSSTTGAAPDVVFDGRIGEEESLPASRAVRIRLSTPPTEPAAALDELVDAYPEQWPIAVVTDDQDLARSAVERGATVLNNGQLLDLFIV